MNISQLPQGSYTPVPAPTSPQGAPQASQQGNQPLNINNLPQGSYTPVQQPPSVGGFLGNALGSAGNLLGGVGNAVLHPIQTVENLGGAAIGAGEQALNTIAGTNYNDGNVQKAQGIENFYDQRYGISDLAQGNVQGALSKIANTLYTDPAGAAADLSMLLDAGGSAAGIAGKLGESADIAKAGAAVGKTADVLNPFAATEKLAGVFSKPIVDHVTSLPEDLYNSALGVTQKMIQKDQSPSAALIDQGIWGSAKSISDQVQQGMQNVNEIINAKLEATPGSIDTAQIIDNAKAAVVDKFKGAYTQEDIDTAFARLPIADLVNNKTLSFSDANQLRQTIDKIIGSPYWLSDATPSLGKDALASVRQTLANSVKSNTGTEAEFKALSTYVKTNKLLEKKFAQASRTAGNVPLKDILAGGAGQLIGGPLIAGAGVGLNELSKSALAKTAVAQAITKATQIGSRVASSLPVRALTNPTALNVASRAGSLSSAIGVTKSNASTAPIRVRVSR